MHFAIHSKYFYSRLTEQERVLYGLILDGWLDFKSRIMITGGFSSHSYERVFEAIHEDIPELFYVDFSKVSISGLPLAMTVNCRFYYDKPEIERIKVQIHEVVQDIVNISLQKKDKLKIAHDYLMKNVKYAPLTNSCDVYSIVGALINHEAVCEGYARSFKLLCDALSVPCIIVSGAAVNHNNGTPERHAWNIVRYEGTNYHVDPTWNAPSFQSGSSMPYYLVSDEYMRRDHNWEEDKWPKCITKGAFEHNSVKVTGPNNLIEVLRQTIVHQKKEVSISFNKTFTSDQAIRKMISDSMNKIAPPNVAGYTCSFVGKYDNVTVGIIYR